MNCEHFDIFDKKELLDGVCIGCWKSRTNRAERDLQGFCAELGATEPVGAMVNLKELNKTIAEMKSAIEFSKKHLAQSNARIDKAEAKLAIAVEALESADCALDNIARGAISIESMQGYAAGEHQSVHDTIAKIKAMPVVPSTGKPITEKEMEDKL